MRIVNVEQLQQMMRNGSCVVVDVLGEGSFHAHHIHKAIGVPYRPRFQEASEVGFLKLIQSKGIPMNQLIVLYSESQYCQTAQRAARALENSGFSNVCVLDGGLAAWVLQGIETEPELTLSVIANIKLNQTHHPLVERILKYGYASIPLSLTEEECRDAAQSFLDFCSLPDSLKNRLVPTKPPIDACCDVGYRANRPTTTAKREIFVFNSSVRSWDASVQLSHDHTVSSFLNAAGHVYDATMNGFKIVCRDLESFYPGIYSKFFLEDKPDLSSIWFWGYSYVDPNEVGEMQLLPSHIDSHAACVLSLAESSPALRIGPTQTSLQLVERAEDNALLFPGAKLHKIIPGVPASWHDVMQSTSNGWNEKIARWSIIFFITHHLTDLCLICGEQHPVEY